tara:strand:- start:181 stop:567 length:387 start_codon:yes stop_codon:yes gene_type:complete
LKQLILVFLGGGFGSIARFLLIKIMPNENTNFPWGTLTVNLLGCFLIGLIMGYVSRHSVESRSDLVLFLGIGICGGFTTFSAFAFENFSLFKSENYLNSIAYISTSVFFGAMLVYLGFLFEKIIYLRI